jgi:hypothetical protein
MEFPILRFREAVVRSGLGTRRFAEDTWRGDDFIRDLPLAGFQRHLPAKETLVARTLSVPGISLLTAFYADEGDLFISLVADDISFEDLRR